MNNSKLYILFMVSLVLTGCIGSTIDDEAVTNTPHDEDINAQPTLSLSPTMSQSEEHGEIINQNNINSLKLLQSSEAHSKSVYSLAFSGDSNWLITGEWEGTIKHWSIPELEEIYTQADREDSFNKFCYSGFINFYYESSESLVVVVGAGLITNIWEMPEAKKLGTVEGTLFLAGNPISPQGQYLATLLPSGSDINIWEMENYTLYQTYSFDWAELPPDLQGTAQSFLSIAFSPLNDMVAAGFSSDEIFIWDLDTGEQIYKINGDYKISFSPGGELLAIRQDFSKVVILDTETWEEVSFLEEPTEVITSIAFSPNGEIIATGTNDGDMIFWTTSGEKLFSRSANTNSYTVILFSNDGKYIVSYGDRNGEINLFGIS